MAKPSRTPSKALSSLQVVQGMVVGWAYDPLRPSLELRLRIDGQQPVSGLTGHPVHPQVFAESTPPVVDCGFQLPLPVGVYDGWKHQLQVDVMEWSTQPSTPKASLTWHSDGCFGEFAPPAQPGAALSGWVGFRGAPPQTLPKVQVHRDQRLLLTLPLHPQPGASHDGSSHIFSFSTDQLQRLDWRSLVFSCQGTVLRKRAAQKHAQLLGAIEHIRPDGLRGWALDMADPLALQDLLLLIDNEPQATVRPNIVRLDILRELKLLPEEAAFAGFDISLPPLLKDGRPHQVNLLSRSTGTLLMQKPLPYQHQVPGLSLADARQVAQSRSASAALPPPRFIPGKSSTVAKPEVSIIILNRNGGPCLEHLFASFERHNSVPAEFIVIDHASSDNSLRVLHLWQSKLPLQVVALDHNASFSASCNRGAKLARASTLLFLNNDIVWQHDALPAMLATLNDKKVAAVGLRLLKTTFNTDGSLRLSKQSPEVQHLGIRFTLVDDCYWPYEVTPETDGDVAAFAPAEMSGVTGAVLLCRKQRFWQVGGFDERYVYGYEDVELCLRLRQRGALVCHNDLVALHHHGYTRLTGREPGMQINHLNNQERLADQIGLWLKHQFWRNLRAGTRNLSGEALTIGIVTGPLHGAAGTAALDAALALAEKLEQALPHARLCILSADRHWQQVQDCHVLLALHPAYDLRQLQQPRADLRTACVIADADALAAWQHNPSFTHFDRYLVLDNKLAAKHAALPAPKVLRATAAKPLGDLLDDKLRVSLQGTKEACQGPLARRIKQELVEAGALVHEHYIDDKTPNFKVNEATITLYDQSLVALNPAYVPPKTPASLSILVLDSQVPLDADALTQADEIWLTRKSLASKLRAHSGKLWQPDKSARALVDRLQHNVELKIGRSFHTP